jgi:hypothetical protein
MARQESKENRQLLSKEVEILNQELQTLQVRVADLQADNRAKDDSNIKLRYHSACIVAAEVAISWFCCGVGVMVVVIGFVVIVVVVVVEVGYPVVTEFHQIP